MRLTVEIVGEKTETIHVDDPEPTYIDVLDAVGLSRHEVSILLDGRPVPEDRPVESEHVTILRMIQGGCR